jgi:hypothetical protein
MGRTTVGPQEASRSPAVGDSGRYAVAFSGGAVPRGDASVPPPVRRLGGRVRRFHWPRGLPLAPQRLRRRKRAHGARCTGRRREGFGPGSCTEPSTSAGGRSGFSTVT